VRPDVPDAVVAEAGRAIYGYFTDIDRRDLRTGWLSATLRRAETIAASRPQAFTSWSLSALCGFGTVMRSRHA